jgi:hypothetical protein
VFPWPSKLASSARACHSTSCSLVPPHLGARLEPVSRGLSCRACVACPLGGVSCASRGNRSASPRRTRSLRPRARAPQLQEDDGSLRRAASDGDAGRRMRCDHATRMANAPLLSRSDLECARLNGRATHLHTCCALPLCRHAISIGAQTAIVSSSQLIAHLACQLSASALTS